MKNFRDIIEDTLIRLEEFQSIVTMVRRYSDRIQTTWYSNSYFFKHLILRWRMAVQSAYSSISQNYNT